MRGFPATQATPHPPIAGAMGPSLSLWERVHRYRSAFFRGWLAGVGYFALCLHWLIFPFFVDAKDQAWMAPNPTRAFQRDHVSARRKPMCGQSSP